MLLQDEQMIANQKEVVNAVVTRIDSACDALLDRREFATNSKTDFEPHHVITIVGGRGTGKTSVLMTIINEVREKIPEALVLDIIHPDQIGNKWLPIPPMIVSFIEKSLETQMPHIAKRLDQDGSLRLRHLGWTLNIDETFHVLSRDSINTSEWNEQIFNLLARTVDPASIFQTWLTKVLDLAGREVVVISIDDADIAIDKAEEIIDTLRTYLAFPRVITVLGVDIPSLERRIRNKRLATLPPVPNYNGEKPFTFLFGMNPADFQATEAEAEQEYVESLLTKVLPLAARCYLAGLSESEKLHKPFRIPGQVTDSTLVQILEEADSKAPKNSGINITPIIEGHPEILSLNVRLYANQYLMIKDAAAQYLISLENQSKGERISLDARRGRNQALLPSGDTTTEPQASYERVHLQPIRTTDELLRSQYYMNIARAFLSGGDFTPLLDHVRRNYGVSPERFETIHDLVEFVLRYGTISSSDFYKLRYSIAGHKLNRDQTSGFVDFCIDWAIANGVKMEDVLDQLNFFTPDYAFTPIPIPKRLSERLSKFPISKIEPNIRIIEGTSKQRVGPQVIVPADRDRLVPVFLTDTNALGRYVHLVFNTPRNSQLEENSLQYVRALDDDKEKNLKADMHAIFYNIFGQLATQAFYHLDGLGMELIFQGNLQRKILESPLKFHSNINISWKIVEVRGFFPLLKKLLEVKHVTGSQKIMALTYLADLPLNTMLACITGIDEAKERDSFLDSCINFLDQLSSWGVIEGRSSGSLSAGTLKEVTSGKATKIRAELSQQFIGLNWKRRWRGMSHLLSTIKKAKFQTSWEGRTQPPAEWMTLAEKVLRQTAQRKTVPKRRSK
jgi:hypothetical protein